MLYYITYINKNQNHEGGISFVTSIPLSERGQYRNGIPDRLICI